MFRKLIELIISEVLGQTVQVDEHFSSLKGRAVIDVEFNKSLPYEDFKKMLDKTSPAIKEDDVSAQDEYGITIDTTEDLIDRVMKHFNTRCKNELYMLIENNKRR